MKVIIMVILILGAGRRPQSCSCQPVSGGILLISEIMPDPDPSVGLPEFEFAEWYNPGVDTLYLFGWQWIVGDKARRLEGGMIRPGGYVIVCSAAAAPAFRLLGEVLVMESFPALRNYGDRLALVNPAGMAVHTLEYSPDQYADALKASGGWSLELADPAGYCNPSAWLPSVDPSGGTPGRANSRIIHLPPAEPPLLVRAAGYDDRHFVLVFSGNLGPGLNVNNYACRLMPGAIPAPAIQIPEYGFPGLGFLIPDGLDRDSLYTVEMDGAVLDCSGQPARLRPVSFGFPAPPDSADVVISEIMFDPHPGQSEFVEVYNRSEHMVDLKGLVVARAAANGTVTGFSDQQDLSYWLFPGCFAVLTADDQLFARAWPSADPAVTAERPDLPALTNVESQLILMDSHQKILDAAAYSPDWHYPYLEGTKGVSLERISFGASGTGRGNWFSASAASGGCTPGSKNSSSVNPAVIDHQYFTMEPCIGYAGASPEPVQVAMSYHFGEPGWFLRVRIFSTDGMEVGEIFPFGTAPVEGVISWDGLDESKRLVPDGIYLITAEYYHPSGKKGRWKKACAVVRAH